MIILSNCLTERTDEGCLKVANSLAKRICKAFPETLLVSYGTPTVRVDRHFSANKLMLNGKLLRFLWKTKEHVIYVPAVAKAHTMAVRVFILSLVARKGLSVIQVMRYQTGAISRLLLKLSRAKLIMFSRDSWKYYDDLLGAQSVYLKAGIDSNRFRPVSEEQKRELRCKYQLPLDKKIVLHVGHMQSGRNVEVLTKLDDSAHGLLVTSTYATDQQDEALRRRLRENPNITVIDTYLPNVEEIYQLADVYLFPVVKWHNCIDVPLSAMEAAACNIPVVATPYGELRELLDKDGFYEIRSFESTELNRLIRIAIEEKKMPRQYVLEYDWDRAVEKLLQAAAST